MKPLWVATLVVIFLLPGVSAISSPTVSFIPAKPSVNSNFIMIANPNAQSSESVYLSYAFPGIYPVWQGTFERPKSGNQWIRYFSNTDPQSNGPNLFPSPSGDTPYTVLVDAISYVGGVQAGEENVSVNISVGGITIENEITVIGTSVFMKAWASKSISGLISYKAYDADSLDAIPGASGTLAANPYINGYTKNITLSNGEYFIEFTATSATDFGGGVARVVVGSTTQTDKVSFDNIVYSPVINPGQKFKIETFKITNTGTENLTALSISVASEISTYLTITPKQTSLEPNESAYLTVALENIQTSMNISTFANLKSGSTQLAQIPVNLMVSVIGSQNLSSCIGKVDKTLCLGGMCCGEVCRVGADCCTSSDCSSDETCSSSFKCVKAVIPGECEGKNDSTTCSTGVCCSGQCVECCSDLDCTAGKTCSSSNTCVSTTPDECTGKSDKTACTGGICCSEYCIKDGKCCVKGDCAAGETCNSNNVCEKETPPTPSGLDMTTIALVGGGVAAAGIAAYFLLKKFRKKGGEGDEELEPGEEGEEEFSDEDFY